MTGENGSNRADVISAQEVINRIVERLTVLVRDLRSEGADIPANAGIDAARALNSVGISDRTRARVALRATLISREEDIEIFERLFSDFWERILEEVSRKEKETRMTFAQRDQPQQPDLDHDKGGAREPENRDRHHVRSEEPHQDEAQRVNEPDSTAPIPTYEEKDERASETGSEAEQTTYSPAGRQKQIDISQLEDIDGIERAVEDLLRNIVILKDRRWKPTQAGSQIDARRALRKGFETGGIVSTIPRRAHRETAVSSVVLVDVSQSVLDTIEREFLLQFLHRLYDGCRRIRIFFFDTDVREVTDSFSGPTSEDAAIELQRAETKWGGGTRIGHAIKTVREEYPYAIDRTATVFVISDGLEVEEIEKLRTGMAWLSRRSNAVYWLNPIATSDEYEPTCRGMAASLPYIDGLFAFAGADDVSEMARQLRLRGPGGNIGYQFDHRERSN